MCDKAVDNYPHTLKCVPDCYMIQKMCDKAVNTHPSIIKLVPEYYKTQEMYDKAVIDVFFHFILFVIGINKKCVIGLFLKTLL